AGFDESPQRKCVPVAPVGGASEADEPAASAENPVESWLLPEEQEPLATDAPVFAADADDDGELDVPDFLR
ncbi:MAG: hypothetical protein K9G09_04785, partial [Pontimonas sp.]|nr:hypothetical protein [Pontimonas sp.]